MNTGFAADLLKKMVQPVLKWARGQSQHWPSETGVQQM